MREPGAIIRTYCVYAALIGFKIEKLAGFFFIEPIAHPVFIQPFLFKFLFCLPKMSRNSFNIPLIESRCHRFTTIGTTQAVHIFPYLRLQYGQHFLPFPGRLFFHFSQKSSKASLRLLCLFTKSTDINGIEYAHGPKVKKFRNPSRQLSHAFRKWNKRLDIMAFMPCMQRTQTPYYRG
jgi:hypothetical protein